MGVPTCVPQDVANVIPERVSDPGGNFSATTHPTLAMVTSIISGIAVEVQAVVGATVDDSLDPLATLTVAVGAAMQVELDFTNDLAQDRQSKYEQLKERYETLLRRLDDAQESIASGSPVGADTPSPWFTVPDNEAYGFPMTTATERF